MEAQAAATATGIHSFLLAPETRQHQHQRRYSWTCLLVNACPQRPTPYAAGGGSHSVLYQATCCCAVGQEGPPGGIEG